MKWLTCVLLTPVLIGCGGSAGEDRDRGALGMLRGGTDLAGDTSVTGGTADTSGTGGSRSSAGSSPGASALGTSAGSSGATAGSIGPAEDEEDVCSRVMLEPVIHREPGNLLVIFDRSSSMSQRFPGSNSRLDAVTDALLDSIAPFLCEPRGPDETPCIESLTVGAILFPSGQPPIDLALEGLNGTPPCAPVAPLQASSQIDWRLATEFVDAWNVYWAPNSRNNALYGQTPIPRAFERADSALRASTLPGKTAVLFLTDGESNCGGSLADYHLPGPNPVDMAADWLTRDIKTYVVSVGGFASGQFNDLVAVAGGTDAALNPTDSAQLANAFSSILNETVDLVDCLVDLNGEKIENPDLACKTGDVFVGPTKIDCDPVNGFQIRGEDQLELLGDACTALEARRDELRAEFPCEVLLF